MILFFAFLFLGCFYNDEKSFIYISINQDICAGATLYADLIHTKLTEKGYYDEEGQFDITEEVIDSFLFVLFFSFCTNTFPFFFFHHV